MRADYFRFGDPVMVDEKLTSIPVSIDRINAPVEYWRYIGEMNFQYNRFDLYDIFNPLAVVIRVDFPSSMSAVADALTEKYGIVFDQNDFEDRELTFTDDSGLFHLTAKEVSRRWIGTVDITLNAKWQIMANAFSIKTLNALPYDDNEFDKLNPTKERIVSSLNMTNIDNLYRRIGSEELVFGTPVVLSNNDIENNTRLTLTASDSDLYTGSIDITYQRQYLPRLSNYLPVEVTANNVLTHRDLAARAATILGIYIDPNDVIEDAVPYVSLGDTATVTIAIEPGSLGYTGELTVDYTRG